MSGRKEKANRVISIAARRSEDEFERQVRHHLEAARFRASIRRTHRRRMMRAVWLYAVVVLTLATLALWVTA